MVADGDRHMGSDPHRRTHVGKSLNLSLLILRGVGLSFIALTIYALMTSFLLLDYKLCEERGQGLLFILYSTCGTWPQQVPSTVLN